MNVNDVIIEIERLRKEISSLEEDIECSNMELNAKKTQLNRDIELLQIKGIEVK